MASRLHYLGVIGQYRKLMEDAITREAVPRDYHSQIKDYFQRWMKDRIVAADTRHAFFSPEFLAQLERSRCCRAAPSAAA